MLINILNCFHIQKEIKFDKEYLQEKLDKKFPIKKNLILMKIDLFNPILFLDNLIEIKINFKVGILKNQYEGILKVKGDLKYSKETSSFYFNDFQIIEIKSEKLDKEITLKFKNTTNKLLNTYFKNYPVYTLDDKDFKHSLAKLILSEIKIEKDKLIIVLKF